MNETAVTTTSKGAGLMTRDSLSQSLMNAQRAAPGVATSGTHFIKMAKDGMWIYGQEETEVEPGSKWAVNPASFKHGYIAWDRDSNGPPVEEEMVSVNRHLPSKEDLPALKKAGVEYTFQRSVELVCVSGEDKDTVCEYKQSSVGAMKLFAILNDLILGQLEEGGGPVPIVTLSSETYQHTKRSFGKVRNPIWGVVGWRDMDDTSPVEDTAEEPEAETAEASSKDEEDEVAEVYAEEEKKAAPRRRRRE